MRIYVVLSLVLGCPSSAFQFVPGRHLLVTLQESQVDDHLHELEDHLQQDLTTKEWDTLETQWKEFATKGPPEDGGAAMASQYLQQTALDYGHTQEEEIEQEHALLQAHQELEQALQQEEEALRTVTTPLWMDTPDQWMELTSGSFQVCTRLAKDGSLLPEPFSGYSHLQDDPVDHGENHLPSVLQLASQPQQSLLEAAHGKERLAQEEKLEAKRTLEELKKNEDILQETLLEFEALLTKKQKELKKIKQQRKRKNDPNFFNELA